jgi:hypothetical protein
MTVQTFRELLSQRPFKPFRLVMSSGESYEVRHPEMAWLTRTSILVGIDETDEGVPATFLGRKLAQYEMHVGIDPPTLCGVPSA